MPKVKIKTKVDFKGHKVYNKDKKKDKKNEKKK